MQVFWKNGFVVFVEERGKTYLAHDCSENYKSLRRMITYATRQPKSRFCIPETRQRQLITSLASARGQADIAYCRLSLFVEVHQRRIISLMRGHASTLGEFQSLYHKHLVRHCALPAYDQEIRGPMANDPGGGARFGQSKDDPFRLSPRIPVHRHPNLLLHPLVLCCRRETSVPLLATVDPRPTARASHEYPQQSPVARVESARRCHGQREGSESMSSSSCDMVSREKAMCNAFLKVS